MGHIDEDLEPLEVNSGILVDRDNEALSLATVFQTRRRQTYYFFEIIQRKRGKEFWYVEILKALFGGDRERAGSEGEFGSRELVGRESLVNSWDMGGVMGH